MRSENSSCRPQHFGLCRGREVPPQFGQFDRRSALARGGARFATLAMAFLLEGLERPVSSTAPSPIVRKCLSLLEFRLSNNGTLP
jgi:hypothetical protein